MLLLVSCLMLYFNSIKVRLKHSLRTNPEEAERIFQFHKGTIKTPSFNNGFTPQPNFNSIKVRLKLQCQTKYFPKKRYFNSIKVRLKLCCLYERGVGRLPFQFHKGTIKTRYNMSLLCQVKNFNSIKVRLKHHVATTNVNRTQFQFHKGTIKTGGSDSTIDINPHFNSIKVRLKQIYEISLLPNLNNFNSIKVRLKHSIFRKD